MQDASPASPVQQNGLFHDVLFDTPVDPQPLPCATLLPSALPFPPDDANFIDWLQGLPSTPAGYAIRAGVLDKYSREDIFVMQSEFIAEMGLPVCLCPRRTLPDGVRGATWCMHLRRKIASFRHSPAEATQLLTRAFRRALKEGAGHKIYPLRAAGAVMTVTPLLAEAVAGLLDAEAILFVGSPGRPSLLEAAVRRHLKLAVPLGDALQAALNDGTRH